MPSLTIASAAAGLDGVEFVGAVGGVEQKFLVNRDALEDLEYELFETDEAMMRAFARHQAHVARVAARALEDGKGGARTVVLQNLVL